MTPLCFVAGGFARSVCLRGGRWFRLVREREEVSFGSVRRFFGFSGDRSIGRRRVWRRRVGGGGVRRNRLRHQHKNTHWLARASGGRQCVAFGPSRGPQPFRRVSSPPLRHRRPRAAPTPAGAALRAAPSFRRAFLRGRGVDPLSRASYRARATFAPGRSPLDKPRGIGVQGQKRKVSRKAREGPFLSSLSLSPLFGRLLRCVDGLARLVRKWRTLD